MTELQHLDSIGTACNATRRALARYLLAAVQQLYGAEWSQALTAKDGTVLEPKAPAASEHWEWRHIVAAAFAVRRRWQGNRRQHLDRRQFDLILSAKTTRDELDQHSAGRRFGQTEIRRRMEDMADLLETLNLDGDARLIRADINQINRPEVDGKLSPADVRVKPIISQPQVLELGATVAHQHARPVTKDDAVESLRTAGAHAEAGMLEKWRNRDGTNGGWDGYLRGSWQHLVPIVWPGGHR